MANIALTLAISEYDHVRDILDGTVPVQGVDLTVLRLPIEEIFYRFIKNQEWDVSEMSFAKAIAFASQGDSPFVPLPVFPSRVFRHSSIYVASDGAITRPEQLAGKRIGVPEWAQTAAVYSRGMLQSDYGVDLRSIHWHQGGVNQAGRAEKVKLALPPGLRLTVVPDKSLSQMLLAGELDAVLSARPPTPYTARDPRVRRLFEDYRPVELAYWKKTGVFPIMHVVAMRREVYERHRWTAMNLFKAFEEAKNRSLERFAEIANSFYPLPWVPERTAESREVLGEDIWPYGIEANRTTLDAFATWAHEQGVCHRRVAPEELFPREVQSRYKV